MLVGISSHQGNVWRDCTGEVVLVAAGVAEEPVKQDRSGALYAEQRAASGSSSWVEVCNTAAKRTLSRSKGVASVGEKDTGGRLKISLALRSTSDAALGSNSIFSSREALPPAPICVFCRKPGDASGDDMVSERARRASSLVLRKSLFDSPLRHLWGF